MPGKSCPTCGTQVQRAWQGRPPVYCGTPCRQAAHRARQAAARAAETARWLRSELFFAETELQGAVSAAFAALAAVHDVPLPGEHDVPGGFEDGLKRQADAAWKAWARVSDLASAHARARRDCEAARARGFRSAEASAPVDDESGAGFVASRAAARDAT